MAEKKKMILLKQMYNDSRSFFLEKVNQDILIDEAIKNLFEKVQKNQSLQHISYYLQSIFDEMDNENDNEDHLYEEYENIIIIKCMKNSAFREICDDLYKLKEKGSFNQELENISTKWEKFDEINSE